MLVDAMLKTMSIVGKIISIEVHFEVLLEDPDEYMNKILNFELAKVTIIIYIELVLRLCIGGVKKKALRRFVK